MGLSETASRTGGVYPQPEEERRALARAKTGLPFPLPRGPLPCPFQTLRTPDLRAAQDAGAPGARSVDVDLQSHPGVATSILNSVRIQAQDTL